MQITILKPGIFSTVQDLGRKEFLGQGVPLSGAMDQLSSILANLAIGNQEKEATLEFTYANAEFRADTDLLIAYFGYGAFLEVNQGPLPSARPIFILKGSIVKLLANPVGTRTYLAIAGGWDLPEVMGSRSTYTLAKFGGLGGRALIKGDTIKSSTNLNLLNNSILQKFRGIEMQYPSWSIAYHQLNNSSHRIIRVVLGPEFNWFDSAAILSFLSETYSVGLNGNRMGLNLNGIPLKQKNKEELLSTAVVPGTIQVAGDGNMILLMADCQTTGGYPRIAQVAAVDLPICGQLKPDDTISFTAISKEDAEICYLEQQKELFKIRVSITMKC
jgi:antagonist of KipI